MSTIKPLIGIDCNELITFLTACQDHDWRRDPSHLPGSSARNEFEVWILAEMRQRCAIVAPTEITVGIQAATMGRDLPELGVEWLVDHLVVLQLGAVVRDLLTRKLTHFACGSVPNGLFWRKNASRDWPRQCLPDRYGWVSDAESIRGFLAVLVADGTAERFCEAMGFTRTEGEPYGGYGPMFFMFYTERQLTRLDGVELVRPLWPEMMRCFRELFDRRRAAGTLVAYVPALWRPDPEAWQAALVTFEAIMDGLTDVQARRHFQDFAIRSCKPLWDEGSLTCGAAFGMDPRWHPVAAVRHLLDEWLGANHLFMGDGYAWSEYGVKGYAEWLLSSFENLDVDRVPVFPGL